MTEDLSKYKQPFDPDWPHGHLYGGQPVRIVATDMKGENPILGLITSQDGKNEWSMRFSSDGTTCHGTLINAPAPKRTWWVNLYHSVHNDYEFDAFKNSSREEADEYAASVRVACIKVTEGEGLENG